MGNAAQSGGGALNYIMMAVAAVFIVMLFISGRGDKKRAAEMQTMVNSLKKDDKVVIFGGIVGTIVGFKDETVEVKISENNKMTVLKSGIVRVLK